MVTTKKPVIEYIEKENILLQKKKSTKHKKTVIQEMRGEKSHVTKNSKITDSNPLPVSNHSKCKRVKLLTDW